MQYHAWLLACFMHVSTGACLPASVSRCAVTVAALPLQVVASTAALQEARKTGTPGYGGYQETDEYIDDAMDSWNEASLDYNE